MDILELSALISGHSQNIDVASNTIVVLSLKVGGSALNTELTKAILDNLVALQDGSDFADGTNAHIHDARYFTEAELGASTAPSGAKKIGVSGVPSNYIAALPNVQDHLAGIDTALAGIGSSTFSDVVFKIYNDIDNSKRIAFDASFISPSTVRSIVMPDADVNLGQLTNSNISAGAAIAYSKLALTNSIVNADISASAAIAYSKLLLTNSIVNADISSSAAIAYSKLSLSNSIVNSDIASGAAIGYSKLALSNSIVNADISASAAIAYSKLNLASSIVDADISSSAAIAYSKLALTSSIVNADISASAAIAYSKLNLSASIVNADIAVGAAIAYSKLNLSASIVNADVASGAAIALNKLAALTASRALASDASGFITVSTTTSAELAFVSGATSNLQTQIDGKISSTEKGSALGVATLDGGGKIPAAQLPNSVMDYKGNWDASTNTPTLADGTGSAGDVYKANVAGTTNFGSGAIAFAIGDWAVYNGTIWEKSNNSNAVNSVNGQTGVVVLTTDNISEGTNQYFTVERAQDAIGSALSNTTTINLTYNDGGNAISADINALSITNALISASAGIVYSKLSLTNSIVNADIASAAAIAYSKLNLSASIVNADIAPAAAIAYSKLALTGSIVNADISASAAIAYSKLNLATSIVNADIAPGAAIVYSKLSLTNSIVNADISASAAIAYSKLALSNSIVNADIAAGAAIVYSKLSLSNSIVNADIAAGAAIAYSKLNLSNSVTASDLTTGVFDQVTITGGNGAAATVVGASSTRAARTAGEAFAINTTFAVRFAINGETAGRVYKADKDASVSNKYNVLGLIPAGAAISAGGSASVIVEGTVTLGAGDTNFGATDIGKEVFLTASGGFSVTAPSATNEAVFVIGYVEDVNKIFVTGKHLRYIN